MVLWLCSEKNPSYAHILEGIFLKHYTKFRIWSFSCTSEVNGSKFENGLSFIIQFYDFHGLKTACSS